MMGGFKWDLVSVLNDTWICEVKDEFFGHTINLVVTKSGDTGCYWGECVVFGDGDPDHFVLQVKREFFERCDQAIKGIENWWLKNEGRLMGKIEGWAGNLHEDAGDARREREAWSLFKDRNG